MQIALNDEERRVLIARIHNWLNLHKRGALAEAVAWPMKTWKFQLSSSEKDVDIPNVTFGVRFATFDWYVRWLKHNAKAREIQDEAEEIVEEELEGA